MADAASLRQAYASRNSKAIRRALAKFASQWKSLDAKTRAGLVIQLSQTPLGAGAVFGTFTNEGLAATIGSAQLPVSGSCVVLPQYYPSVGSAASGGLDAGPSLFLNGTTGVFSLKRGQLGQYSVSFGSPITGQSVPPGVYEISGTGGKDVGAFNAEMTVGSHPAISNKPGLATVDRTQPLTITWTGGVAGNYVLIGGNTPGTYSNGASVPSGNFVCAADAGAGSFTVPTYILSSLNATGTGKGGLGIAGHPLSNLISIPGLDIAYFVDGSSDSVNVTFK